ncbi:MAG TPA: hypothetical protein VFS30_08870 [Dehalococcoidia bacterium]|nr:hypothetical protein [Dehalococcoidia bacterium]
MSSGLPAALTSIWGTSPADIWAVGGDSQNAGNSVMHFDGDAWTNLTTGSTGDLWWVFGFQGGPVFMGGAGGLILRYQDGDFERMQTPGTDTVYGIWGPAPDDLWAVGGNVTEGAFAWRFDGSAWTEAEGFPPVLVQSSSLFKVWGASAEDVWLVGTGGAILHYDGDRLTQVVSGTTRDLFTVSGNSERAVAVGGFGTGVIVENDGSGWRDVTPPTTPQVVGVVLTADSAYAVGIEGAVLHRIDGEWTQIETGIPVPGALHSVWVDPEGGVWAVGGRVLSSPLVDGVIIHKAPPESTS